MSIDIFRAAILDGVRHGFLGRRGGVSHGIYADLNVGTGSNDTPEAVLENRNRATMAVAPGATLVTVHQVHSPAVVTVTAPFEHADRPEADAMVTDRPGLVLGILTADCAPVLFADADAGVIGAAHAGWKGALGGVVAATVDAMVALGARRDAIAAAVGPCIARRSYEVDDAFLLRFQQADADFDRFFTPGRAGHHQFDLEGFVAARLAEAGIGRIAMMDHDTYSDETHFFSYRRTTHRKEADYGRQISLIALPA